MEGRSSAEGHRTSVFGVHTSSFVIETNEPDMVERLESTFRDLRLGGGETTPGTVLFTVRRHGPPWASHPWGVWRDGVPCSTTILPTYVMGYVLWEITRLLLENVSPHVPIHSGAVTQDGRAVLLAGRSHAGEGTLTAWLTTRGWGFLTEEVATLDLSGDRAVVQPFWRPAGVRRGGPLDHMIPEDDTGDPALVPASTLGSLAASAPLAAVVLPVYSPGHSHELEPLTPAETLVGLTEHLPLRQQQGRRSFASVAAVAEAVPGYALRVDDLDEAERRLRDLLAGLP